jgi:hypothetical protein
MIVAVAIDPMFWNKGTRKYGLTQQSDRRFGAAMVRSS